ncbi:hypothetical protein [Paenibacillus terrae]|nr:hypothetical protein [Paenibacillus terrae]
MKNKMVLTLLVTSFALLMVVIIPYPYQEKGSTFEPTGHHGGF